MPSETLKRPTETRIDLDALAYNFHSSKQFIGSDIGYMAVVKADAYGHGAAACARRLQQEGIDWFGVAIPEEGVELRKVGITIPILCLGSFWSGQEDLVVENDLTPVVFDLNTARLLNDYAANRGLTIEVHVKVDTGMGRVGIPFQESAAFAHSLTSLTALSVRGLMTHFASAEDVENKEFTELQIERFDAACNEFRAAGHNILWVDLANSPGAIAQPGSRGNLVRLGGALYGLLDDILPADTRQPPLKPVLSLHSRICDLRKVPEGYSLGYGRTFVTERPSLIALVPIGYADGYPRGISNLGNALVNGVPAPVVGRISMDWTLLDVTGIPGVERGHDVILIGQGTVDNIKAADLARLIGTIGYEITCGISPRVPRVFLGNRQQE